MRIAIMGSGGVGGYFGARLAEAGEEVTFIARGGHLAAIQARGLGLKSIAGDALISPARATDDPASLGPVDLVVVAVKTWQLPEAAQAMKPLVGPGTMVLPLQNGVEASAELVGVLGSAPVLGGLCRVLAFVHGPGEIHHTAIPPTIELGELEGTTTRRVEALAAALNRCRGVTATLPPNIQVALWAKFLFIAPVSAVGAVTRVPIDRFRTGASREILVQAMEEIATVGRALGVPLPADLVERTVAFVDSIPPGSTSSMQRDIMEGRPSELEAQVGAVVRLGARAGVAVPASQFLYGSLLPQEQRVRG